MLYRVVCEQLWYYFVTLTKCNTSCKLINSTFRHVVGKHSRKLQRQLKKLSIPCFLVFSSSPWVCHTTHCFMCGLSITGLMSQTEKQDTTSLLMIQIYCAYMKKPEAKMVWWGNYFSVNQKSVLATRVTSIMQTRYNTIDT